MSSLGPNEPYPEEGQMADLRTFIAGNHHRHPDWTARRHHDAAFAYFGSDFVLAVEDHTGESFDDVVADLLMELS